MGYTFLNSFDYGSPMVGPKVPRQFRQTPTWRALLILPAVFLVYNGCVTEIEPLAPEVQWDYSLNDGADAENRFKDLSNAHAGASFKLLAGQEHSGDTGWQTALSFIHLSDVQIRESKIGMDNIVSWASEWVGIGGSIRHPYLDQNDEYAFLAMVRAINDQIQKNELNNPSFVIHTGDAIDVGTQGEFLQFVAVANLLDLPWFNVIGNHDVFYFGNFTQKNLHSDTIHAFKLINSKEDFSENHSPEAVSKFPGGLDKFFIDRESKNTPVGVPGSSRHGFDLSACGFSTERDNPYYSFVVQTNQPHFRIIVLDTVADDPEVELDIGQLKNKKIGALPGTISENQFNWLRDEIRNARAADQLVLVFGHHPLISTSNEGPIRHNASTLTQTGEKPRLVDFLIQQDHVLGYFGGHTHSAAIRCWYRQTGKHSSCKNVPENTPVFQEVIAPSIHEWPQEGFWVRVLREEQTNQLAIAVRPIAPTAGNNGGSLAEKWRNVRFGAYCDIESNRDKQICKTEPPQLDSVPEPAPGPETVALTKLDGPAFSRRRLQECSDAPSTLSTVWKSVLSSLSDADTVDRCTANYSELKYQLDRDRLYITGDETRTIRHKISDMTGVYFQGKKHFLKLQAFTPPENAEALRALSHSGETRVKSWVFVEYPGGQFRQITAQDPEKGFPLNGIPVGTTVYIVAVYDEDGCHCNLVDIWVEVDELAGSIDMDVIYGSFGEKKGRAAVYEFKGKSDNQLYELKSEPLMDEPAYVARDRFQALMKAFPTYDMVKRLHAKSWGDVLDLWQELEQSPPHGWHGTSVKNAQTDLIVFKQCQRLETLANIIDSGKAGVSTTQ